MKLSIKILWKTGACESENSKKSFKYTKIEIENTKIK